VLRTWIPVCSHGSDSHPFPDFVDRSMAQEDGPFSVGVRIRIRERKYWRPIANRSDDFLRLLESKNESDMCFKVGDSSIRAHRCILALRAPKFLDIIGTGTGEKHDHNAAIELPDLDPSVFRKLLRVLYRNSTPTVSIMKKFGLELLKMADRFGCQTAKLMIESDLAEYVLRATNAAEMLIVADSLSCALLKEAIIEVFKSNQDKVMDSPSWATVAESAPLLDELLQSTRRKRKRSGDSSVDRMNVSTLRRNLEEKGLDVDGTKDMLIKRLKGE